MGKTYRRVTELLKIEFDVKKVTKYTFCKKTGINPTSVERYLCGISEPTQISLEKLSTYFGVPVTFLRGEDTLFLSEIINIVDEFFETNTAYFPIGKKTELIDLFQKRLCGNCTNLSTAQHSCNRLQNSATVCEG